MFLLGDPPTKASETDFAPDGKVIGGLPQLSLMGGTEPLVMADCFLPKTRVRQTDLLSKGPFMTTIAAAERSGVLDVILDVLARHKDGGLTDIRARGAITAFITSLAPDDLFSEALLVDFEVFVDITLQLNKVSQQSSDVSGRVGKIADVGLGDARALASMHG